MSTFLVTGGAGFIGSHLCDALVRRGDTVRVLDDLSTGSHDNLPPGVTLIEADVADPDAVRAAVEGVDGAFHLAAIASVARGVTDWLGTHRANLTGTITLLDAIRRRGVPIPVVYASSAAVYGDCPVAPIGEDAECRPLSAYGADKYACELHARVASHVHGIPTTGLRFFNVYGPRQDPRSPYSGVISIFCERVARGAPIDVFGDGGQTRDFVFVADVVATLLAAMRRPDPGAPVFNVCTGTPTSVLDLARTIAELAGTALDVRHREPRAGEIRHSTGMPQRARAAFGLGDPVPLRVGLRKVLDWLATGH
ncbi:MAG: NAD-dependent epimerase/dehydratase family protein [Acetobacteraceae bacterium]|jgi:UDP-glucose 4-epimerase